MRFDGRRIDQDLRWRPAFGGQGMKDVLPNALVGPADKPIVKRLAWPIGGRSVHPATAGLEHMNDTADNPAVVHALLAARIRRQVRLKSRKLFLGQPEEMMVHSRAPSGILESKTLYPRNTFYGSEP